MASTADPIPPTDVRPKDLSNDMEVDERVESNSKSEDLYTTLKTLEKKLEFLEIQVRLFFLDLRRSRHVCPAPTPRDLCEAKR